MFRILSFSIFFRYYVKKCDNYIVAAGSVASGDYADQTFHFASENSRTTDAINNNDGMAIYNRATAHLFLTRYALGQYKGTFGYQTGDEAARN
jgi:hypothetical protein